MTSFRILRALAGLLLLSGCTADKACTLIGCTDGLSLALSGGIPASFELTLSAEGQAPKKISCPGGTADYICLPQSVFVNNYTPDRVELTLSAREQQLSGSYTPVYTSSEPNGPGCGPSCRQGRIELTL